MSGTIDRGRTTSPFDKLKVRSFAASERLMLSLSKHEVQQGAANYRGGDRSRRQADA